MTMAPRRQDRDRIFGISKVAGFLVCPVCLFDS